METWIISAPQVIDIDVPVTHLRSSVVRGLVSVVAHDEPNTRIEVHSTSGQPIEVTLSDSGELSVGYPFLSWDNFIEKFKAFMSRDSAEISIAVPRTVAVKLGTVSGEGFVTGTSGNCDLSTVSGSLTIDSVNGAARLDTVSGNLYVRGLSGNLLAQTVSGPIIASGEIPSTKIDTVSGDVTLDLNNADSAVKVDGISSRITIRRPAESGVTVKAATVAGRVVVDDVQFSREPSRTYIERTTGDGALWVQTNTVSGDITILTNAEVTR